MANSIRLKLIVWYAVVLLGIVAGFAITMYQEVKQVRFQELDTDLLGAANYVDSTLRQFPPPELDPRLPPKLPKNKDGKWPNPKEPHLPQLRANLPPPGWPAQDDDSDRYLAVRRDDTSYLVRINFPNNDRDWDIRSEATFLWQGDYREVTMRGPYRTQIVVGRSIQPIANALSRFARQLIFFGLGFVIVGLSGGWWISSRIVPPLRRISQTASRISASNLSERIVTDRTEAELKPLAEVLNDTFSRLEAAFAQLTRFTADASHELRTPLAILKSSMELALHRPRSVEEYRETLQTCLKTTRRMTQLVEGLLLLARADAGKEHFRRESFSLKNLVEEAIGQLHEAAKTRKIEIEATLQEIDWVGDEAAMQRVVMNLLENAIHYNRVHGEIRIQLQSQGDEIVLSISDTGCGIPASDQAQLFERFFRADKARHHNTGGNGLGLAICRGLIEAQGGRIDFVSEEGKGSTFRVSLPRVVD